jgi:ankyrin repeat protein
MGAIATRANDDGNTPLHYACQAGSLAMAERLLGAGAARSAANADGDTPFLLACFGGHLPVAQRLHALGERPDQANALGCHALLQACASSQLAVAAWLLPLAPSLLERADTTGWTPLRLCAESGHAEMGEWLLHQGAVPAEEDAKAAKRSGCSALYKVLKRARKAQPTGGGSSSTSKAKAAASPEGAGSSATRNGEGA